MGELDRYLRQMTFPGLGTAGQERLRLAAAVQVGCGGLGSTLAQCLVRAGVGRYTIIDKDQPDLTNLHRQFLFDEADVARGRNKALTAARKLRRADSGVKIKGIAAALAAGNADRLLRGHDLVLDGLDDLPARYLINDWCVKNNVPWIYGGVVGACGMTMVIRPGRGPCLRCLWPEPGAPGQLPTCASAGIINTTPVVIAALQATEAIKLLSGSREPVAGFRIVDLWEGSWQNVPVRKNPDCPACGRGRFEFLAGS